MNTVSYYEHRDVSTSQVELFRILGCPPRLEKMSMWIPGCLSGSQDPPKTGRIRLDCLRSPRQLQATLGTVLSVLFRKRYKPFKERSVLQVNNSSQTSWQNRRWIFFGWYQLIAFW